MNLRHTTSTTISAFVLAACVTLSALPAEAGLDEPKCAQPLSSGTSPVASDCLFLLKAAVGLESCSPACICAPTGSLPGKASDALLCLAKATGQAVTLACPCGGTTTTSSTSSTTTTSTTTTTMGGNPIDPFDLIGLVTASRDRSISNSQLRGPSPALPINEAFTLAGGFGILTNPGPDPDTTVTTEQIAGCTVVTIEQLLDLGGVGGVPMFTPLDPGSPGSASNGSVQLDLPATGFGGFEADEDPLAAGFDGGQTVQFSWPGGADINAFANSIAVPPTVEITTPDLTDPAFDLIPGLAINVAWVPGSDQDGNIGINVSTSTQVTTFIGQSVIFEINSVTIDCQFPDGSGSGTVPVAATARLHSMAPAGGSLSKSFGATRENHKQVSVSAPGASGPDVVGFFGLSSITRSISAGFTFP